MNGTSQLKIRVMMGVFVPNGNFFSLTVCALELYFKKRQRKDCFAPIDSSAEVGPALPIAISRENDDAMRELTEISRPAYSVYTFWKVIFFSFR